MYIADIQRILFKIGYMHLYEVVVTEFSLLELYYSEFVMSCLLCYIIKFNGIRIEHVNDKLYY